MVTKARFATPVGGLATGAVEGACSTRIAITNIVVYDYSVFFLHLRLYLTRKFITTTSIWLETLTVVRTVDKPVKTKIGMCSWTPLLHYRAVHSAECAYIPMKEGAQNIEGDLTPAEAQTRTAAAYNKALLQEHISIQEMMNFFRKCDKVEVSVLFAVKCIIRNPPSFSGDNFLVRGVLYRIHSLPAVETLLHTKLYNRSTLHFCLLCQILEMHMISPISHEELWNVPRSADNRGDPRLAELVEIRNCWEPNPIPWNESFVSVSNSPYRRSRYFRPYLDKDISSEDQLARRQWEPSAPNGDSVARPFNDPRFCKICIPEINEFQYAE